LLLLTLLLQVELPPGTSDEQYLSELQSALSKAAAEFPQPHLIIYNAGEHFILMAADLRQYGN
jgi:hypothetical protein